MAIGISSFDRWLIYISLERTSLPKQNLASSFLLKLFYDNVLQKDCMHRIMSFVKVHRSNDQSITNYGILISTLFEIVFEWIVIGS